MKRRWLLGLAVVVAPILLGAQAPSVGALGDAIVGGASASVVLQGWCADHGLPPLIAGRVRGAEKPAPPAVLAALAVRPGEPLRYRRVTLACGAVILSEADNWYVPGRLTRQMNRRLDTTDAPFGLVARPLHFTRRTLQARRAPDADHILEVTAVLVSAAGAPFSYVIEDYRRLISFGSTPGQ
jgi:hypothetical protein